MRKQLNKSEIKKLNEEILQLYNVENFLSKKDKVEIEKNEEFKVVKVNSVIKFFFHDKIIIPVLRVLLLNNFLKKIVVDMGAIKFVTSGADIMRPGVVEVDAMIKKYNVVVIVDETHKKPLAIGIVLFDSADLMAATGGKVIQNIHYVSDKLWEISNS